MDAYKQRVKEGGVYQVKIEGIGEMGDGIAKVDGFVLIVAKPVEVGNFYTVKATKLKEKYGFAEVIIQEEEN